MPNTAANHIMPAAGSKDAMSREYSAICGYTDGQEIPVGSVVKIHSTSNSRSLSRYCTGKVAVVTAPSRKGIWDSADYRVIALRLVEPPYAWNIHDNYTSAESKEVEVLMVGNGTVIPGVSYRLCEKEIWDAKFRAYDFSFDGCSNAPTFLAALCLRQDSKHVAAIRQMLRRDNTVNPVRIASYFRKDPELQIDDWAPLQGNFPERSEYRVCVNWEEVSQEFNQLFKEEALA